MSRMRTNRVLEPIYLINMAQIIRESLRVMLLHPNHFNSISVFLFSPFPVSLFISHFLVRQFPQIPSSTLGLLEHFFETKGVFSLPNLFSKAIVHAIICFPSSITFSLLGRAATIQAVSDNYNGIILDARRLFMRSGLAWIKLLHTSLWELLIILGLFGTVVAILAITPKMLLINDSTSSMTIGYWIVVGLLGVAFCVAFAHVMVVGNLAKVLSVSERECYGLDALLKARSLMEGRRHTALTIALFSNMGFRLIECLFDYRVNKGIGLWEGSVLVSMYSLGMVFDTVMNVVLYYACKP